MGGTIQSGLIHDASLDAWNRYPQAYKDYYMGAFPSGWTYEDMQQWPPKAFEPLGEGKERGMYGNPKGNYTPMSYDDWRAMQAALGYMRPDSPGTPTTPPAPTDNLLGLMKQSADPFGTYGQMGVNEPYLSNINNRFGWSSQGLAYPTQLQASPTWYNPPIVYPDVVQPPIKSSTVTKK
jgi:hypothetical protein